ncbi:ChrR family anti-sigma-E factor [Pararhodobacter zhoushanensis]|uniref:ChrR family anti-sigma-E factor n=1 Tax=Pararhodobacter zhoushanensis TaxID=2479545 RepID=A0ABT3GUZ2_9RHOB|nr:ChrR family anti-sigma-E factor [Pararhodobacter zhoushanensis]MCW1931351.1 ChrR family anti-sigma-E factor [Pararhodobacter zhoushanensis]
MIRHHLSDSLLTGYSTGSLPEAFSLLVATHVSLCDECRARLEAQDAVGGAVLESCEAVAMSDSSFAATLALLGGATPEREKPAPSAGVFPAPLREYIGGDAGSVRWRPVGGGVRQAILPTAKGASARLLYIPAGTAVPDHGHTGTELTLVLSGAFDDATDHFGPGDVEIADEDLEHTPVAAPGEPCICLAVTDAPLRFNGLIPRLLQPFLKI